MKLLFILLILLVLTRLFGELAERLGQPALVGELVSGVHAPDVTPVSGGSSRATHRER